MLEAARKRSWAKREMDVHGPMPNRRHGAVHTWHSRDADWGKGNAPLPALGRRQLWPTDRYWAVLSCETWSIIPPFIIQHHALPSSGTRYVHPSWHLTEFMLFPTAPPPVRTNDSLCTARMPQLTLLSLALAAPHPQHQIGKCSREGGGQEQLRFLGS